MYRLLLKGCVTAKSYVSIDSKSLNKMLIVYLCFFIFFQGACHSGCTSGIDHVCHVGVGIGDCHSPVWHKGDFGICGPVVFVPSHSFGFLGAACKVLFGSCMLTGHLQSWGWGTLEV